MGQCRFLRQALRFAQTQKLRGLLQGLKAAGRSAGVDSWRTMLFGELFPAIHAHQRRVQIVRLAQAQRLLQQDLARRVVGQVFSAHHIANALRSVIDHHR